MSPSGEIIILSNPVCYLVISTEVIVKVEKRKGRVPLGPNEVLTMPATVLAAWMWDLIASNPCILIFLPWSLMTMKGLPYYWSRLFTQSANRADQESWDSNTSSTAYCAPCGNPCMIEVEWMGTSWTDGWISNNRRVEPFNLFTFTSDRLRLYFTYSPLDYSRRSNREYPLACRCHSIHSTLNPILTLSLLDYSTTKTHMQYTR